MRNRSREGGAVLVTVAVSTVALIAAAALALDLGSTLVERRHARNAADHAALAAAWADCHGEDPQAAANASVIRNDYETSELTLSAVASGWEAKIDTATDTTFARIIGIETVDVSGSAVADCSGGSAGPVNAIYAFGNTCSQASSKWQLDIGTSDNTVWGGIHSNGDTNVSDNPNDFGPGNAAEDPFTYVTQHSSNFAGSNPANFDPGFPLEVATELPVPTWPSIDDFQPGGAAAVAAGVNYYPFTGTIKDEHVDPALGGHGDGVYYTTGDIELDNSDYDLNVTLIARGFVKFSGSNSTLSFYLNDYPVLAAGAAPVFGDEKCDKFQVSLSGSGNDWSGIIYAPGGLIEWNGSGNETLLSGSLLGYSVRLNGSDLKIVADPDLFPPDDADAKLVE